MIRNLLSAFDLEFPNHNEFVADLTRTIERRCGAAIVPQPGDSLALSVMRPKTAALAYDKVYRIPVLNEPVPPEAGFYGASPGEIAHAAVALFWFAATESGISLPAGPRSSLSPALNERESLRMLATEIAAGVGREPTLFYEHSRDQDREFQPGPEKILTTAITNLELVDEKGLTWEQVLDFRRDKEARRKYRRLVRWLDSELKAGSETDLVGVLEERLEGYQWAIRKHGLNTAIGVLSALLDPKFLGGASAAVAAAGVAAGTGWAALAGVAVTVGKALVSFGTAYVGGVEARRGNNYEVAYLHEIQRQL